MPSMLAYVSAKVSRSTRAASSCLISNVPRSSPSVTVLSPSAATVKKPWLYSLAPAFAYTHHAEARLQPHGLRGVGLLTWGCLEEEAFLQVALLVEPPALDV